MIRFIISIIIIFCACNNLPYNEVNTKDSGSNKSKVIPCINYDSLLINYANKVIATSIDLNGSMSPDLRSFILTLDSECLRSQAEYKYFVALILSKMALHHLQCCNQNYDLYQMREGAAIIIINEFSRLAGYEGQKLEMLNSGLVFDFIKADKKLLGSAEISEIIKACEMETVRIHKGI